MSEPTKPGAAARRWWELVYCLLNFQDGRVDAGRAAAQSAVHTDKQVVNALQLLGERFASVDHDGPRAYAAFLVEAGDSEGAARLRQEAVAVVRNFLAATR